MESIEIRNKKRDFALKATCVTDHLTRLKDINTRVDDCRLRLTFSDYDYLDKGFILERIVSLRHERVWLSDVIYNAINGF